MADQLPSPRAVVSSLFTQLASTQSGPVQQHRPPSTNPLKDLAPNARRIFVTLHCGFPNEFLPALDLLDRRLVTRLAYTPKSDDVDIVGTGASRDGNNVYYVTSSQSASKWRHQSVSTGASYEVRLKPWHCSCPAFAFAAFSSVSVEHDSLTEHHLWRTDGLTDRAVGGLTPGEDIPPVCKHLLACYLAEECGGLFAGYVEKRNATKEEMMGWAAGWGDR
ncbi:MAG: tRNA methyltransferase, has a role in tRNA modification [Chaenotheca gracillima]|nr:MAG: tRNA methyltransferase, has a role in tRNA modification [Chaenotheca gracillima]